MTESIDRLADQFAARFGVVSSGEVRPLRLAVAGIASVEDYARVSRFLERLTAVEGLSVERLEGDVAVFRVALRGRADALAEAIALGRLLSPEPAPTAGIDLGYRVSR